MKYQLKPDKIYDEGDWMFNSKVATVAYHIHTPISIFPWYPTSNGECTRCSERPLLELIEEVRNFVYDMHSTN